MIKDRRNTTATTLTYTGGYTAGGTGLLTASGATFLGTASDVGRKFRLFTAGSQTWNEFEITAFGTTTSATVKTLSIVDPTLQATATTLWAEPSTTFDGLDHLEGQTVTILADGGDHPTKTVSGGSITLDQPAAVAVAGYGYTSEIQTMPVRVLQFSEDTRGSTQSLNAAQLYFWKTGGCEVSFDNARQYFAMPFREPSDPIGYPPTLKTRIDSVTASAGYGSAQQLYVRSVNALPLNIMQIIYHLDVNDAI